MRLPSIFVIFAIILPIYSAPRSKTRTAPQTVYDQKQTGDYNIQLHLKDFQIIAVLADDSLGSLGDYDYNYDYSDFTVKPGVNVTLKPPPEDPTVPSTSPQQDPILSSTPASSEKPEDVATTAAPEKTTEKAEPILSTNSPDRIKVHIIEGPLSQIVPNDDLGVANETPALGEILHYRRCASGYSRDKKGRCRRVRRPVQQAPFVISRLASNLAARFREASGAESGSSESESAEK